MDVCYTVLQTTFVSVRYRLNPYDLMDLILKSTVCSYESKSKSGDRELTVFFFSPDLIQIITSSRENSIAHVFLKQVYKLFLYSKYFMIAMEYTILKIII